MVKVVKPKIGIIYSSEDSSWSSCVSISANLRQAYFHLEDQFQIVWLAMSPSQVRQDTQYGNGYLVDFALSIFNAHINKICIVDHHVQTLPLVLALKSVNRQKAQGLEFYFHVYGDFTYFSEDWQRIGQELRGLKVALLCASERHAKLVNYFVREPNGGNTNVCPFPVDTEFFAFDERTRQEWRQKLGVEDKYVLFYSGRLSLQKGVFDVIEAFAGMAASSPDSLLVIAGPCDDIGCAVTGIKLPSGYFFQRLEKVLAGLAPPIRKRIRILGHKSRDELRGIYCAADSFVSLSLYHDEDFGMAPAEALASGLPCLLSDWGGYASFEVEGASIRFAPVTISSRGLRFDHGRIRSLLAELLKPALPFSNRVVAGQNFAEMFSVEGVAQVMRKIFSESPSPFSGFGWQLNGFKNPENLKKGMYEAVYQNYTAQPKPVAFGETQSSAPIGARDLGVRQ